MQHGILCPSRSDCLGSRIRVLNWKKLRKVELQQPRVGCFAHKLVEGFEASIEENVRVLDAATGRLAVPSYYVVPHFKSLNVSLSPQVAAQN
jgi:hypothetical protein